MIPKEIFQKIRRIQITSSRIVSDVFAGQYHSIFKGRGMEFDEVREYLIGDDIRTIDWNVTARTGRVHIKKYVEERELTVMLLVDASRSCHFGSVRELKSQLAAEIAALLAFAAIQNNDKVGLIIFTDRIEKFIPPRRGLRHVLRVIREVLYFQPRSPHTDITQALDYLNKVTTRRCVSFLISDFFEHHQASSQVMDADPAWRQSMAIAHQRHDMIAITLNDPLEQELKPVGLMEWEDAETGKRILVDATDRDLLRKYRAMALKRLKARDQLFESLGMDHIDISTDRPYADEMIKFFLKRRKKFR